MPTSGTTVLAAEGATRTAWHVLPIGEVARLLASSAENGLSEAEAVKRLGEHGPNRLPEASGRGIAAMLAGQFSEFMIVVLLVAAAVSALAGDRVDAIVIIVIVLLNGVIGFVQEYRAEQAIAALRSLAAPVARVRRSGRILMVPAADLVPGDLVLLEAGAVVPADLRLVESASLALAEAALTGESEPVAKTTAALPESSLALGDRHNLAYKGTVATYGRGAGLVVATGAESELGRVATLLANATLGPTPLQRRLVLFGRRLAIAVLGVCVVIFVAGLARGEPVLLMFMTAVSLAVAAIPEALPAVVAIALALGARRMVQRRALVRNLPAVETLGSVTCICSDKTGTLTQNRMTVQAYWVNGERNAADALPALAARNGDWDAVHHAMALANDASPLSGGGFEGEPTEAALLEAALAAGLVWGQLAIDHPRIAELPFDSERKRMSTLHAQNEAVVAFVKGAPESLLPRCVWETAAGLLVPFESSAVFAAADAMAAEGLRVLAFASRHFDARPTRVEDAEEKLVFLGLVGLMDPPRPEAAAAVAECRAAGISAVMITGDHPATARAIAQRLGIMTAGAEVLTGTQLAALSDEELARRCSTVRVYARVDPEQKIRIVEALQANGECVAMTGDGVNDAPALRRADIGVAMGRGGTDVAREAADMVLLDDNFATIVHAVREGRRIFDNIRKFIRYAMTGNAGEIWTIFLAPFLGLPIPLLPIHILWVNLVTDGLPGLALTLEPVDRHAMERPPRPVNENIFARGMWQQILWVGLLIGAASLFAQAWALKHEAHAQSMVFTVLTLSQLGLVLAIRSETESLLVFGVLSNRPLMLTVAGTLALQMAVLYVPWCNTIFHTGPLGPIDLAMCFVLGSLAFCAVETEKWLRRRVRRKQR